MSSTDEQRVLALREQGQSYRQIMAETGLSRGRVGRIIRAAKDAPSLETETLEPPAGGSRPLSPAPAPEPASRPESPSLNQATGPAFDADQYRNLIDTFAGELRARLEGESSRLARTQLEATLATFEAASRQALRAVEHTLNRREQELASKPARIRKLLDGLAKELANAEARLAEAERTAASVTTEHGMRRARQQVEHEREKLDNIKQVIAWREGQLERAEAACSN